MRSRHVLLVAAAALAAVALPAAAASAKDREPPPWLNVQNGMSQPQPSLGPAIEETVFVESEIDSDGDGARDRVRIRLSRPSNTEGYKIPVIFEHSPYRGNTGSLATHN